MPNRIVVDLEKIVYQPELKPIARVILAHGAGAGNQHVFMEQFSVKLAELGIEVHSINFPYMQMAYELDKKRPPNSNKQLVSYYTELVLKDDSELPLFISGKSMGGRIATQILADSAVSDKVSGAFVLGYPFMPPGKPEKLEERVKHFDTLAKPVLILQGERDTFGSITSLSNLSLPNSFNIEWITSGDHSFKPLKKSGVTLADNISAAAFAAEKFIKTILLR